MAETAAEILSYEDLYERWEKSNWSATAIDFSADKPHWEALNEIQKRSMRWQFAMFFAGEDAVTDDLSPYIDAAPREEQKYFLATQQVDEARHSVFFHRFFAEVLGTGDTVASGLASCGPDLNWSYRAVFDLLERTSNELRSDKSLPMFAKAITAYHIVVESVLAQPGQHFIEDYLTRMDIMPGFRSGMENVSRDEQRHIGFGVKVLSELFAESDECKAASAELLHEAMRYTLGVFIPPNWDRSWTEELGFTLEEIFAFGFRSFESKLRATGMPIEELPPGVLPVDPALSPEERAKRMLRMAELGMLADPAVEAIPGPEAQRLLFDAIERSVDTTAVNGGPVVIQWRFSDADPYHLTISNGSTRAEVGEAPKADVTLESSWGTWVELTVGGGDPRRAMLRRKLRPRGSLRTLRRLPKIFPAPSRSGR